MFKTLAIAAGLAAGVLGTAAAQAPSSDKPGRNDAPITILPSGNRLVVTSEDPEALRLVQELVRLMTRTAGSPGDFDTIRLKHANAADAAQLLDELYNGTRSQNTSSRRGGQNSFADPDTGLRISAPAAPRESRIRVVADPATNTLLLWANGIDRLNIHRLLETSIDVGHSDSSAIRRTWLLPPLQFATAAEVAQVLREVYRETGNSTPRSATTGGFNGPGYSGFGAGQNPSGETAGNGRTSNLSIGVDERSNSLVLVCSEKMKDEVKGVIDQLENAAKTAMRTVRVVSVRGVDPLLVQQAIEAIQGRNRSLPRSNSGTMPELGPTRLGPSGWNGFFPAGLGPGGNVPGGLPPSAGGGTPPGGAGGGSNP